MGLSDDQIDNLLRSAEERLAESVASTNATASKSGGLSKTKGQKASAGQAKQKDPVKDLGGRVGLRVVSDAQMGKNKKKTTDDAGPAWFGLPKTELTPQLKRDLQLLRLRGALDPKAHFKKHATKSQVPRYCHVGQVIEGPTEFFSARLTKKDRKKSFAEEILATTGLKERTKARYSTIQEKKMSGRKGFYKKLLARRGHGLH